MPRFQKVQMLLGALFVATGVPSAQPNILYINADDLGVMDVGFNNELYHTPNIDKLRAEGMLFTQAYAPAANCAPSRACVFSGQYSPRHGVYTVGTSERGSSKRRKLIPIKNTKYLDLEMPTLADALKQGGYKTIHLGKWHLGEDPTQQGFDKNVGGSTGGGPGKSYYLPVKSGPMAAYNDQYPKKTHFADVLADQAVKFISENKDGKEPLFIHMAYFLIHTPLIPVTEMVGKYEERGKKKATYASMIEKMDESIGKILTGLEAAGLSDNTLVLFCSDNGAHSDVSSQKPHRSGKGSYFEGGIREPLVVRWPGKVTPGSSSDVPVCGIDFFPTFLEVAGLSVPKDKVIDGVSLVPLLTKSGAIPDRALFWHFPVYLQAYSKQDDSHDRHFRTRPGSAMRHGKWKLHEYFEDGRLELYDLETDPGVRKNLAKAQPEVAKKLHQRLLKWRKEMKAPVPTKKNPKYEGS
ncbi:MAG: sulfatase [Akkermansiaceae bacterium]